MSAPLAPHRRHPGHDSHRFVLASDGEIRCTFCDCKPSRYGVATKPCDSAPAGWRDAEAAGRPW